MTERGNPLGWLIVLVLLTVAGLLLERDYHLARTSAIADPIGKPAPDATVARLDGAPLHLFSRRGRPVWLNFFATWCHPCKAEMPLIEERYVRYKKSGLEIVGLDQQESAADVARFAKSLALTFPLAVDAGHAAGAYRVFALPTSVFVDARGVIAAVHTGAMSAQQMDQDLAKIIPLR
ncbi:MAG TPA: redoxin domain-containing protein [Candidatus Eremiobacteraceae bacterium]|nr:redoxin domain-containing protein [Candidatus Eremiobacteraceae bacterium]